MPSRGQTITLSYIAWDNGANAGKTGDVANHTLKWIKDGTAATPTNSPAEVDSANAPGVYKLTLTGTECTCDFATLAGKSSTASIVVLPISVSFEQLPTAAPASANGLTTYGTGTGQINPSAGGVDVQTVKGQAITCGAGVTIGPYVGNATAALAVDASGRVDLGRILGTASAGAAGYAGLDWGHVTSATTAVNLSGTTISTSQATVATLAAIQPNYAPALAGAAMALTSGERTTLAGVTRDIDNSSPAVGSLGAAVNAAASSGDPLTAPVPGSYASGTAGYLIGTNLNASVSSRSTYAGTDTSGTGTLLTRIGTPATASIAGDIAVANTALAAFAGLYLSGVVSSVTSASAFTVNFSGTVTAADLVGLQVCFRSVDRSPAKGTITTAAQVDGTHVALTFATAFSAAPSINDSVMVI